MTTLTFKTRRGSRGGGAGVPPVPPTTPPVAPVSPAAPNSPPYEYLYPSDDMIKRNRAGRAFVFVASEVVALVGTTAISRLFFDGVLGWPQFGTLLGLGASAYLCSAIFLRSYFENGADQGAITVNPLMTLFGRFRDYSGMTEEEKADQAKRYARVAYGPGGHFTYWWEQRAKEYNVSLAEATEDISFLVQCTDGTLTGIGSFRLRADIRDLVGYQLSAGAIASNLADLIKAEAVAFLGTSTVEEATSKLPALNAHLTEKFGGLGPEQTDFERRFSVFVGDITIGELKGSDDVLKTLNAVSEGKILPQVVAATLGYKDMAAVRAAVKRGTLTRADVTRAEERAQQISQQGDVQTNRNVFDLNINGLGDLDPETARNIAMGLSSVARTVSAVKGGGSSPKPKSSGKGKSS